MYSLVRPLLFSLSAEAAHEATLTMLKTPLSSVVACRPQSKPVSVMGLDFPNPVGLAAGLDKNGECLPGLAGLGFGFLEIGTVTPRPQLGNEKPRMFRLPKADAVINRMGFNNHGVDNLLRNVERADYDGILGINIGKNKDTPNENAVDDYLFCLERVHQAASYVVVNVSSPNTPGLRSLQHGDALDELLSKLREAQTRLDQAAGRRVPLVIKIAPDNEDEELADMAQAFVRHEMDGVIVGNTTLSREAVKHLPHSQEAGGLSGKPLKPIADLALQRMATHLDGKLPIIGVGGIHTGADVKDKVEKGAALVQIYTGMVYRGPALVKEAVNAFPVKAAN